MAPPSNRRSGFSRRAQYTTFFSYAAGVAGALVGLVLLAIAIFSPGAFSVLNSVAADATEPAAQASAGGRSAGKNAFATISGFFQSGSEHARVARGGGDG